MTRINVDLSDLLAPIRQMREEIQKMNEALRSTVQLQSQMAAHQRQASGGYSPTKSGLALEIQDRIATRGGPSNVYSIGTGAPIPPSNINPIGLPTPSNAWQVNNILNQRGFASSFANALTTQANFGSATSTRERDELIRSLGTQADKSSQIVRGLLLQQSQKFSELEKSFKDQTSKLEVDPQTGKLLNANTDQLEKLNQTIKELIKANAELTSVQDSAVELMKKGGGDGPPGGGGFRGIFDGMSRGQKAALTGAALLGGAGMAMSGLGVYMGMRGTALQQDFSNAIAMAQAKSEIGGIQQQNFFAMAAPRTGEQMLRAYGNLLAPAGTRYEYLGFQNNARTLQEARRLSEESRSAETLGIAGGLSENAGGFLRGAGGMLAGRVLGSGAGQALMARVATRFAAGSAASMLLGPAAPLAVAGLTAYSAYDLATSAYGMYKNYQEGMGSRVGQELGGRAFGNERLAIENQRQQKTLEVLRNQEILRQGELGTFGSRMMAMGLDEYIMTLRNRTAMTSAVGGRAALGFEAVMPLLAQEAKQTEVINRFKANLKNFGYTTGETNPSLDTSGIQRPISSVMQKATDISQRYAELGYTFAEAGALKNNLLMAQRTVSNQELYRAMQLTRAGVGTGEQIASNILGISAVSGKAGDLAQLEKVFARAFSAGLKGSAEIQRFVQASNEISNSLKLQNAVGASDIISSITSAMRGASGSSLMFMAEAQKGISGFAATSGATTGLMGTIKAITGAGAGLTAGSGLGIFAGANAYQIQDAIKQIESGAPVESMTGLARQMIGAQRYGGVASEAARSNVLSVLKRGKAAIQMPFAAGYEMMRNESFAAVQGKAAALFNEIGKGGKGSGRAREQLKDLLYSYGSTMVGMGGADNIETAQAQFLASLPPGLIESGTGKRALEREIAMGQQAARSDFISVNYKKMLNKAAMAAVGKTESFASEADIKDVARSLGIDVSAEGWQAQFAAKARESGVAVGKQVSFRDLANIISAAGGEEMSKKSIILEDISVNALQRLQKALGMKVETPEFFDAIPGPK